MEKKKSVKRKADDGDDVEIVNEAGAGGGGGGGGKKKAKAEKAPPKPKAPPKLKKFTPEDEEMAKGASMERNKAMATYLEGIWSALKAEGEYIKAASAKKGYLAMLAWPTPFRVAAECAVLQGVGASTVEKLSVFLQGYGKPEEGLEAKHKAEMKASGKDQEFQFLEDSDKEVVLEMLRSGGVTWDKVKPWRTDIADGEWL